MGLKPNNKLADSEKEARGGSMLSYSIWFKTLILISGLFLVACTNKLNSKSSQPILLSSVSKSAQVNSHIQSILGQKNLKISALYNGVSAVSLIDKMSSVSQPGGDLTIQVGETVVIDSDIDVGVLTINGTLACSNDLTKNAKIKAATIYVNGLLECGSSDQDRFLEKLTVILKDSSATTAARRGLVVNRGGQLKLFGLQTKVNWTRISETARAGESVIVLDNAIARGWEAGDQIIIGPTGYNPAESEMMTLTSVASDGRTLRLSQPLKYNHWGTVQTFKGKDGDVQLDQRAEVANLNRNIKIMPDESNGAISDADGIGGHVMVMPGGKGYVDSVELSRLGQAGNMGRYPFHWHMAGDVNGQFIRNSSIHHSFQRCVTVHTTQRALVHNNVCYDYRGHGYFLEEGDEIDNIIIGNLAMNGRRPRPDKILLQSDLEGSFAEDRASAMSGIWISHPRNIVRENTVSGTEGTGIWMSYITGDLPNANGRVINNIPIVLDGQQIIARPTLTATSDFSNNVSHTNIVGVNWDGAPGGQLANNPRNKDDKLLVSAYYTPAVTPTYSNLTVYKNTRTGIYYRGNTAIFDKNILADNGWNFFVSYNQILMNSTIIGQSNNLDENDYNYMFVRGYSLGRQPTGIILYDGPAELINVNLLNFSTQKIVKNIHGTQYDLTPTLFYEIGGHNKYMSLLKNVYVEGKPFYKFNRGYRADDEKSNFTTGWYDVRNSTHVRDLDGSLTGRAGSIIVPDDSFIKHPGCVSESGYDGFVICDGKKSVSALYMVVNNSHVGGGVPFLVYRNDGPSSIPVNNALVDIDKSFDALFPPRITAMNNKFSMLSGYEYTVVFRRTDVMSDFRKLPDLMGLQYSAESMGETSPVIKFVGLGQQCRLGGSEAVKVASLDQLRTTNSTAYYAEGNSIAVRFKTNKRYDMSSGAGLTKQATVNDFIHCDQPPVPQVLGYYEFSNDSGKYFLSGWACDQTVNESTDLHLYVGTADREEKALLSFRADQPNETQVLAACGNYKGNYRFRYELSEQTVKENAGKTLYLHGISRSGGVNSLIDNVGSLKTFPAAAVVVTPQPPVVVTPPAGVASCKNSGDFKVDSGAVFDWACECTGDMTGWRDVGSGCYHREKVPAPVAAPVVAPQPPVVVAPQPPPVREPASPQPPVVVTPQPPVVVVPQPPASGVASCKGSGDFKVDSGAVFDWACECSGDMTGWRNVGNGCYHREKVPAPVAAPVVVPTPAPPAPVPVAPPPLAAPPESPKNLVGDRSVIGYIDTINADRVVYGWVCNKGIAQSINIHIYAGLRGQSQTVFVAGGLANQASEDGVAKACGVSSGAYRFIFKLPPEASGKLIYVYGISISGDNKNLPLERSGLLTAP